MYPATPRHPLSARKSPSKPSTQPSETSSTGGEIAAAAAAAASSRIVRVTSNYSEDEMAGNNDEASEGESKEERPTIREHSERSVRKSASEGMNTLREGDIQELATSEPMPEDAAQTWQNRWRRQSMEDPEAPIEAAPVESRGSWARSSCGGVLDAGQRPSADGLELASDVKLVSIPDIAPEVPQVPVLPAPGEARRPQEVHRESIGGQSVEGTRTPPELLARAVPVPGCDCTKGRAMARRKSGEGRIPADEERRARRHALHAAELVSPGAPLKMRIERRLAAMQETTCFIKQDAENVECPVMLNPRTPEFGEAPRTPRSRSPTPVTPDERRRKSRRITFSALNDALDDVCVECPQQSAQVASNIQAAQELSDQMLELVKKMFANPSPDASKRQSKKRSRARQSDARSSVGPEAMTERALRLWQSSQDDDDEDVNDSRAEAVPLLATPGRFRYRSKGPFQDPWASLPPRRSSPSRSKLPPPPSQPPP
eukprot:symbB.v1.2.002842.t1/scaffold144.1/size299099/20